VNEIIIAGERVNVTDTSPKKQHVDIAPITYYLADPTDAKIKVLEGIFHGSIEFSEENPIPPCKQEDKNLLENALERRLRFLSTELEKKRAKNSIVTRALVQHHRKLETMISALKDSSECNQYDGVATDFIKTQQDKTIEKLVLQFAFLVLQGTDPIDLTGHPAIQGKAANAKALVKMLSVNPITEAEIDIYKALRKNVIPDSILKILNNEGDGIAAFQPMIDAAAAEKQKQLVLAIIDIIEANEALKNQFTIDRARLLENPDPSAQITAIVQWLVGQYVLIQVDADACAERVRRLGEEAEGLHRDINALQGETARLIQVRGEAITAKEVAERELGAVKAENTTLKEGARENATQIAANEAQINRLQEQIRTNADELAVAKAAAARGDAAQAALDDVNARLRALEGEIGPLRAKAAAAEARVAELEALLAARPAPERSAELEGELAAARAEAAAARRDEEAAAARATTAEAATQDAAAKIEDLKRQLAEAKRSNAEFTGKISAAAEDVRRLQAQLAGAQATHGAALAGVAADATRSSSEAASAQAAAARAAAEIQDAQANLQRKTAELEQLKDERAATEEEVADLRRRTSIAEETVAAEKATTKALHDYLVKLSTAISRGEAIPAAPVGIPTLSELIRNIDDIRGKKSQYQCFLAYYVKFFMTLLFKKNDGREAYNAVKADLIFLKGDSTLYETLGFFGSYFNDPGSIRLEPFVPNVYATRIMGEVFGPDAVVPSDAVVPTRRERNEYDMIMLFIVASQLYLVEIAATITGCAVPNEVLRPTFGGPAPPQGARSQYDYLRNPEQPWGTIAAQAPPLPGRGEPGAAGAAAFNVDDSYGRPLDPLPGPPSYQAPRSPAAAPTPARRAPSPAAAPRTPVQAPVATTAEDVSYYLKEVNNAIKAAGGVRFTGMTGNTDDYIRDKWVSKSNLDAACARKTPGTEATCNIFNNLMRKDFSSLKGGTFREQLAKDTLKRLNLLR
jgi:chromosome segregation ATPase